MKKQLATLLLFVSTFSAFGQLKYYKTENGEFIFSFARYQINNESINTPMRFSGFFHYGEQLHIDFNNYVGVFSGWGIRNVGFTSSYGDTMYKRRNYYVGIPVAIKLGDMKNKNFIYAGAEVELAVNYKEKLFVKGDKIGSAKFNSWFSERTPLLMPSVFGGFQMKSGYNLGFRYYLKDFLNPNFSEKGFKPYQNTTQSNVFYISLSYQFKSGRKAKNKTSIPSSI